MVEAETSAAYLKERVEDAAPGSGTRKNVQSSTDTLLYDEL